MVGTNQTHTMIDQSGPWPVLLIGASKAMFGDWEGPWNLAARLEKRLAGRLSVEGLIDIDVPKAQAVIDGKRKDESVAPAYAKTQVVASIEEFAGLVSSGKAQSPKAIFVAIFPNYRGGLLPGHDLEVRLNKHFPTSSIFAEKPVTAGWPWVESVRDAGEVARVLEADETRVASVGYMFRYLGVVAKVKEMLKEANLQVMSINIRFATGYDSHVNPGWWDKTTVGGPVVEQCTHLCDLARYFGGEVDYDTLSANAVEADEPLGQMNKMPIDDSHIPEGNKIPRTTAATWKFENGAVCNLLQATALLDFRYEVRFEIIADGYDFVIDELWYEPKLSVRRPGSTTHEVIHFSDDPYYNEVDAFVRAVEGDKDRVLSPFSDAVKTYELTHRIRAASEASTARRRAKEQGHSHASGKPYVDCPAFVSQT